LRSKYTFEDLVKSSKKEDQTKGERNATDWIADLFKFNNTLASASYYEWLALNEAVREPGNYMAK